MLVVPCAKSAMIDKQINHAYEAIALVAKYLKEVLHVAHHMDLVYDSAQIAKLGLNKNDIAKLQDFSAVVHKLEELNTVIEQLQINVSNADNAALTNDEIDEFMNS